MEKQKAMQKLERKLDKNYSDFVNEWLELEPTILIEHAEEIAATKLVYDELKGGGHDPDYMEYLLRFKNPLEVVRDKWIEEQFGPDISGEMSHVLWSITDRQDAEQDYALDEDCRPPAMGEVMMC